MEYMNHISDTIYGIRKGWAHYVRGRSTFSDGGGRFCMGCAVLYEYYGTALGRGSDMKWIEHVMVLQAQALPGLKSDWVTENITKLNVIGILGIDFRAKRCAIFINQLQMHSCNVQTICPTVTWCGHVHILYMCCVCIMYTVYMHDRAVLPDLFVLDVCSTAIQ